MSLLSEGFFDRVETRAGLKCEGKEPPVSDHALTIDATGVTRMPMKSFNKLVGMESHSDDLHRANRTRWRTSLWVIQIRFYKTCEVSGGINTLKHEPEKKMIGAP